MFQKLLIFIFTLFIVNQYFMEKVSSKAVVASSKTTTQNQKTTSANSKATIPKTASLKATTAKVTSPKATSPKTVKPNAVSQKVTSQKAAKISSIFKKKCARMTNKKYGNPTNKANFDKCLAETLIELLRCYKTQLKLEGKRDYKKCQLIMDDDDFDLVIEYTDDAYEEPDNSPTLYDRLEKFGLNMNDFKKFIY